MRTASTIMCLLTLLGSTVSSAPQSEAAAEAHAELEAKKAEAVASEPQEAAEAAPAPARQSLKHLLLSPSRSTRCER